jgi:hypothetical protein
MKNRRKGSLLIMVLLILFVAILFASASIYSVVALNNLYKNENEVMKENIAITSLINEWDNITVLGDKMSNERRDYSNSFNGEIALGKTKFDYLNKNSKIRKYLIFEAKVEDTNERKSNEKIAYKPVPLFNYSHFVINPDEELGNANIIEENYGIVRANKENNNFTNITGNCIKDSGKPYIYMQNVDVEKYALLAENYGFDFNTSYLNTTIDIYFYKNNTFRVLPENNIYNIKENAVICFRNNNLPIRIVGIDETTNLYSSIQLNFNITFVSDSPIFLESDIINLDKLLMISTAKDDVFPAISFNINKYIDHKLYPDKINIDLSSIYCGTANGITDFDEINTVILNGIFFTPNGSFGILENTYSDASYNNDCKNNYWIRGGIIEYNVNYPLKKFEILPSNITNILIQRSDNLLNINSYDEIDFIAPPISKNIFIFNKKYFM